MRNCLHYYRWKRNMSTDPDALERLQNAGKIVKTPCKNLPGQRSSCYDDRFILEVSQVKDAAIISNDNYADLLNECNGNYQKVIAISNVMLT